MLPDLVQKIGDNPGETVFLLSCGGLALKAMYDIDTISNIKEIGTDIYDSGIDFYHFVEKYITKKELSA